MGCLPPDLFVCVCARAGCELCARERKRRRRRAHTLPQKHGNIFKLYVYRYLNKRSFQVLIDR